MRNDYQWQKSNREQLMPRYVLPLGAIIIVTIE